jgi:hypothetical protein
MQEQVLSNQAPVKSMPTEANAQEGGESDQGAAAGCHRLPKGRSSICRHIPA